MGRSRKYSSESRSSSYDRDRKKREKDKIREKEKYDKGRDRTREKDKEKEKDKYKRDTKYGRRDRSRSYSKNRKESDHYKYKSSGGKKERHRSLSSSYSYQSRSSDNSRKDSREYKSGRDKTYTSGTKTNLIPMPNQTLGAAKPFNRQGLDFKQFNPLPTTQEQIPQPAIQAYNTQADETGPTEKVVKDQNLLNSDDKLFDSIVANAFSLRSIFDSESISEKYAGKLIYKAIQKMVFNPMMNIQEKEQVHQKIQEPTILEFVKLGVDHLIDNHKMDCELLKVLDKL